MNNTTIQLAMSLDALLARHASLTCVPKGVPKQTTLSKALLCETIYIEAVSAAARDTLGCNSYVKLTKQRAQHARVYWREAEASSEAFAALVREGRVYGTVDLERLLSFLSPGTSEGPHFDVRCVEHGYDRATSMVAARGARHGNLFVDLTGRESECRDVPGLHLVLTSETSSTLQFQGGITSSRLFFEDLVHRDRVRYMTQFFRLDALLEDPELLLPAPSGLTAAHDLKTLFHYDEVFVSGTAKGDLGLRLEAAKMSADGGSINFKLWQRAKRRVAVTMHRMQELVDHGLVFVH